MNIYIDESGSINNHSAHAKHFVVALVCPTDLKGLKRAYKRFVSKYHVRLLELDQEKVNPKTGKVLKPGNKMFINGKFNELKGAQFDPQMKKDFVRFFSRNRLFEVFYIVIDNTKLSDRFCDSTARAFNYSLRLALSFFIHHGLLPQEPYYLQLDERNERPSARLFLEDYLNTELYLSGGSAYPFQVEYFDSSNNHLIQIADVFANLMYSHLKTNKYSEEISLLKEAGIIKSIFLFPPNSELKVS